MPRDLDRIEDMLTACRDVMEITRELNPISFAEDKVRRLAILHSLTIIGEAANAVSPECQSKNAHLPWRRVIAFRHRIVHGYGQVDLDLVWQVATAMVPDLHRELALLREQFPDPTQDSG